MEYLLMYLTCIFAVITIYIYRKYVVPFQKSNEKMLNEEIKIPNNLKGIEFVKNLFPEKDILIKPIEKIKGRGEYKPITNKVLLTPNFENKLNFVDITTALHEFKHKKDRIITIISILMTIFVSAQLLLVLISEKLFLGYTFAIISSIIAMALKGIIEIRAVNYAKTEIHKYLEENSTKYKKNINKLAYRINVGYVIQHTLFILVFSMGFLILVKEGGIVTGITNISKLF